MINITIKILSTPGRNWTIKKWCFTILKTGLKGRVWKCSISWKSFQTR